MKNKSFLMIIAIIMIAMSSQSQVTGKMTDARDGKVYKTVIIGTQTWMAENLNYESYGWCYDENNSNCKKYGPLYKWKTAMEGCPSGWHLPNDAEWSKLIDYLGGKSTAGGKLKSTKVWYAPNVGASNSSGFNALPGGKTSVTDPVYGAEFIGIGIQSFWWISTESDAYTAKYLSLKNDGSDVFSCNDDKNLGMSVRCVKDK